MTQSPIISVILPVYNCEKFVSEAVQSVLNQTFTDFELLIIDDCSTDATVSVIQSFSDQRINLISKEKNSGYTDSLNYAISIAKGKYIARMDGDDICFPTRFQRQIEMLESNEDVIMCGTAIQIIDSEKILRHPINHDDIKVKLCFSNAFFHPTVVFRKEAFSNLSYNREFEPAEDYDLWTRLVFKGKLMNTEEVLLHYRVHANQVSNYKNDIQKNASAIAQLRMFQVLLPDENIDLQLFKQAFKWNEVSSIHDFRLVMKLYQKIQYQNNQLEVYKRDDFNKKLNEYRITFLKFYFVKNGFHLRDLPSYFSSIRLFDFLTIMNPFHKIKKKFV
ncbi:glycosyltransferase family 2 protein [Flavobacterium sp.]|uniref:glycosyltransferase family 2 protein n=1 Tax=Flavobacterium sp. TaxID=239 RepID=UPI002B4AFBB8|nr:glycosyltransferase [Flavobacterium sp.]HLP63685.1 glycosyltransferase [Flavobacterium sp.]